MTSLLPEGFRIFTYDVDDWTGYGRGTNLDLRRYQKVRIKKIFRKERFEWRWVTVATDWCLSDLTLATTIENLTDRAWDILAREREEKKIREKVDGAQPVT